MYLSKHPQTKSPPAISLLTLPIPTAHEADEAIQTLLSSYLLHALTAVSHIGLRASDSIDPKNFCDAIYKTETLIYWLPHLQLLPTKHKDSVLTRTYTALNRATSNLQVTCPKDAKALYRIRLYGLLCLAHTSPGTIDADTFWNQVAKWTVVCAKDLDHTGCMGDSEAMASFIVTVSATFNEVIEHTRQREDHMSFMNGRGFLAFCEYWMSFARRVSGIHCLYSKRS